MRRLVISDTHLGRHFSKRKFNYLANLFERYDEIILNGDFWDYYSFTFDKFVNSKWRHLFPIMQNKTIYIYGNHDKPQWVDKRVNLFSKAQLEEYVLELEDRKFIFTHGHLIENFRQVESDGLVKLYRGLHLHPVGLVVDYALAKINVNRAKKIEKFARQLHDDEILVVGHKHISQMNVPNNYVIGGSVLFGKSSYLEVGPSGRVSVLREGY